MKKVFKDNPNLDLCYETSDKKCFYLENDAINHAKSLKNKKVVRLTREAEAKKEETNKGAEK